MFGFICLTIESGEFAVEKPEPGKVVLVSLRCNCRVVAAVQATGLSAAVEISKGPAVSSVRPVASDLPFGMV